MTTLRWRKLPDRRTPLTILLWSGLVLGWLLASITVSAQDDEQARRHHFIVAVDVSGDMGSLNQRGIIADSLPRLLYGGLGEDEAPPVFRPGLDRLSLVSFALTRAAADDCKALTGFDARPPYLYSWWDLPGVDLTRERFGDWLRDWLVRPCRIVHGPSLSPIVTAEALLAVFVGETLAATEADTLFDRTFLVVATNEAYNRSPARELAFLARRFQVENTGVARTLMERLSRYFYVDGPEHWTVTVNTFEPQLPFLRGAEGEAVSGFPLVMRVAELRPVASEVNAQLDYPPTLSLDRVAVSASRWRLSDAAGRDLLLRFLPSRRFAPVTLTLEYRGEDGQDWQLAGEPLPRRVVLDLDECPEPVCRRDDDGLHVDLLGAAGLAETLGVDEPLPSPGEIRFQAAFRYLAEGLYDHQRLHSDWQTIPVAVVPPRTVGGTLFFPPVVLDNPGLTALWRVGDTALGQQQAQERLLAQRAAQEPLYIGSGVAILLAVLLVLTLLLYWRAYHRPFQPVLEWLAVAEPTVDFDQLGGQLLLGRLVVRNAGRVPWFGRLLGNDAQPRRLATLTLSHRDAEQLGFRLRAPDIPLLGFMAPGEEGKALTRALAQEVTHDTQFHVFMATDTIGDFVHPVQGDIAVETLGLDFQLDWRRRGQDTRVALRRSADLALQLRRERTRPPLVDFEPMPSPPHFQQGETVQVGNFFFQSTARRQFAQPCLVRFEILARREGGPLREDAVILDGNQVEVAGEQTVEVAVWILCDGERVRNPQPLRDDYDFRLVGEFAPGSQPGPHIVRLYRDQAGPAAQLLADHRRDG